MDTIRDMLSVGQERNGVWAIYLWEVLPAGKVSNWGRVVATFPREDEAWGVTVLILEYVEKYLYPIDSAIRAAMQEYHEALGDERALDNEPTPDELAYQDHAHIMATYPN